MIDRIVRHWNRAVSALVANLKAEVDDVLLADLQVVRDFPACVRFAPSALVQSQLCVNQFAMVLDQPINTVVRTAAFFIGGKRNDDVAIRFETLSLVADRVAIQTAACALSSPVPRP